MKKITANASDRFQAQPQANARDRKANEFKDPAKRLVGRHPRYQLRKRTVWDNRINAVDRQINLFNRDESPQPDCDQRHKREPQYDPLESFGVGETDWHGDVGGDLFWAADGEPDRSPKGAESAH